MQVACKAASSLVTVHRVLFRGILDESLLRDSDPSLGAEEQAIALPASGNPYYHVSKYPWPCQRQDDILFYRLPGGHQQSLAGNSKMKYKCQPCCQLALQILLLMTEHLMAASA